jgi:hypothetical protein
MVEQASFRAFIFLGLLWKSAMNATRCERIMVPPGTKEPPIATRAAKSLAPKRGDDEPNHPRRGENAENQPLHKIGDWQIEEEQSQSSHPKESAEIDASEPSAASSVIVPSRGIVEAVAHGVNKVEPNRA